MKKVTVEGVRDWMKQGAWWVYKDDPRLVEILNLLCEFARDHGILIDNEER